MANLQVADLSHVWSPFPQHKIWVQLLEEELFKMGDRERQLVRELVCNPHHDMLQRNSPFVHVGADDLSSGGP